MFCRWRATVCSLITRTRRSRGWSGRWRRGAAPRTPGRSGSPAGPAAVAERRQARSRSGLAPSRSNVARAASSSRSAASWSPSARQARAIADPGPGDLVGHLEAAPRRTGPAERDERARRDRPRPGATSPAAASAMACSSGVSISVGERGRARRWPARGRRRRRRPRGGPRPPPPARAGARAVPALSSSMRRMAATGGVDVALGQPQQGDAGRRVAAELGWLAGTRDAASASSPRRRCSSPCW